MLQIHLHGPIIAAEIFCRWLRMGPVFLPTNAADTLGYAHYRCRNILPMATNGPSISTVTTPPMVGPTWPRVRSPLGSDCLPALSQGTFSIYLFTDLFDRYLGFLRAHVRCPMSGDLGGCTSTFYLSPAYARGRPLSWYPVSHDGLCTICGRTAVLMVQPESADALQASLRFYYC